MLQEKQGKQPYWRSHSLFHYDQAKASGDLPVHSNPAALARFILTIAEGMSIQAADGVSRAELQEVIEVTLQSWPS
ncbi:hypothetical protein EHS13_23290 [Paenibacillus psychroresistens]|uniref:TetR/AcrR family transcriptional regulator n=1 Tax=Paenibacillus psychroresistens TaxID=1778678 RepID=A0A6B8RQ15_9BACL|nr:hypothetical protein [Paenibacillus psychroresistens]QGQ97603.1 hypothetical protein EHS13_23290 [Paenibacillus psychroresistens]